MEGQNGKYGPLWSCHAKKMTPFIFVPTLTFSIKNWLCWLFSQSVDSVDLFSKKCKSEKNIMGQN